MSNIAIKVENLSKKYDLHRKGAGTLRDTLANAWKQGLGSFSNRESFWALKDVAFEVPHGQVLGIIGRNGAGKSTLLKILSRITPPTKGRVELDGRVASLLEVGTGFHPELTGRENIFLNGAILGMSRAEIRRKFDEIVDFSGVERFLDTPVKHYSSGMYVRLAFAVAAHLEAEILLIDEVLAVGDVEFQRKCLGKMGDAAQYGKTVIFVSHNMGYIERLCSKALLIDHGKNLVFDQPSVVINHYSSIHITATEAIVFNGPLKKEITLKKVLVNDKNPFSQHVFINPLLETHIKLFLNIKQLKAFRITLSLFKQGCRLFSLHDSEAIKTPSGLIECGYIIPDRILRPGLYEAAIGGLEKNEFGEWFWRDAVFSFSVVEQWAENFESINHGLLNIPAQTYRKKHDP